MYFLSHTTWLFAVLFIINHIIRCPCLAFNVFKLPLFVVIDSDTGAYYKNFGKTASDSPSPWQTIKFIYLSSVIYLSSPPPNRKSLDMCRYISMRSRRKTYFRQKHPTFFHFYFVKGSSNWSWHTAEWRYNSALNKHDLYSSSLNGVHGFAWSNSRR